MIDILQVHKLINEILPGTLVGFSVDTLGADEPMVRLSVRHEAEGVIYQAQNLFSDFVWQYTHLENIESWFRETFKEVL